MMKTVLVTGAAGFMGRNVSVAFRRTNEFKVLEFVSGQDRTELKALVQRAETVFHLAGVNRPRHEREFIEGNVELTRNLCEMLADLERPVPVILSSSIQAEADNPYGRSKREGEKVLEAYHETTGAPVYIYRFPNVFGKWSRPEYNTVVATFCHHISRELPVEVSDRGRLLNFAYIDDITNLFLEIASKTEHDVSKCHYAYGPVYQITLGELHDLIVSFHENRKKSVLPDLSDPFTKYLYSTYISFYDTADLAYPVDLKTDARGWLFELIKSPYAGQIFVSRTHPGITRGNHYHDTKIEKFCVIQGEGLIRFRHVLQTEVVEHRVDDKEIKVVDIPPGYTHSIENTGDRDMITLFWANEIFDPERPDTHFVPV